MLKREQYSDDDEDYKSNHEDEQKNVNNHQDINTTTSQSLINILNKALNELACLEKITPPSDYETEQNPSEYQEIIYYTHNPRLIYKSLREVLEEGLEQLTNLEQMSGQTTPKSESDDQSSSSSWMEECIDAFIRIDKREEIRKKRNKMRINAMTVNENTEENTGKL